MADTVIQSPTSSTPEPNKSDARIGNSNDKSWAGWAISSFTNKLAAADGEIASTAAASKPSEDIPRPASLPRPTTSSPSIQPESTNKPLRAAAHPLSRSQSDRPVPVVQDEWHDAEEGDDVFDAWGAIDEDDDKRVDPFTAAVTSPNPSSPEPTASKASAVPYDDGGEPDFAGWLAAKNQAKSKNPLPKGLSKSTPPAKLVAKPRVVAPAKKIDTKPKDEDVDDGWGDAWD
jgi:SCY1-like protein 1